MRWVMVDEVARRLQLDGWAGRRYPPPGEGLLLAEGTPPHAVCLKAAGGFAYALERSPPRA